MARPRKEINWEIFEGLCSIQCTRREIADVLGCSEDTIKRAVKREKGVTFEEYAQKFAAKGKVSLRRKQYELALAGNVTMLVWLGKQYLEQKEKQEFSTPLGRGFTLEIKRKEPKK